MQKTREEVALQALRMLGVVAADEPATSHQMSGALSVLDGIWAEVSASAPADWDIVTGTPMKSFVPLAQMLAADLAAEYGVQPPMTRARARLRLLASYRTDDRDCYDPLVHDYGMWL